MKIVIVRHGDAVFSSNDRVLSQNGIKEVSATGQKLSSLIKLTRCYSSPKTRAMQTANIIAEHNGYHEKIEYLSDLTPSGDAHQVIDFLTAGCGKNDNVLLVSHLPLVEILAYDLNRKSVIPPQFDTACALILNYDGEKGEYERFISPYDEDYTF